MPLPPLPDEAIRLGEHARDWREAVRLSGRALQRIGAVTDAYPDEMVRMIEEHGPYIVIAPGLALAHARPGPAVLADGISVVTLDQPVAFGHPYNDPVRVVVGLGVHSAERHIALVASLAAAFDDPGATAAIADAEDADAVRRILGATREGDAGEIA